MNDVEDFKDSEIRASDQDRERVAEALRENYAQGRLTLEEFDERTTSVYAAKTLGDLRGLTRDLPAVRPVQQPVPAQAPPPARGPRGDMWWIPVVALAVAGIAIVSVATGHMVFWPLWVFVFIGFKAFGRNRPPHGRR